MPGRELDGAGKAKRGGCRYGRPRRAGAGGEQLERPLPHGVVI